MDAPSDTEKDELTKKGGCLRSFLRMFCSSSRQICKEKTYGCQVQPRLFGIGCQVLQEDDTEAISEQMKKMEGMMVLYGEQARFCHAGSNDKCAVDGEAFDNQQEVYQPSF